MSRVVHKFVENTVSNHRGVDYYFITLISKPSASNVATIMYVLERASLEPVHPLQEGIIFLCFFLKFTVK